MVEFERGKNKINERKVLSSREWDGDLDPNEVWGRMSRLIKDIAKDILGETNVTRIGLRKDAWWWNADVERAIHENSIQFKIDRNQEIWLIGKITS